MTESRLLELLEQFPREKIAVVGDFFLDKYQEIDPSLEEVSVETGRAAHQVVRKWSSPGAAGTVVNNLHALGAGQIQAFGMIADDGDGYDLRSGLQQRNCGTDNLIISPDSFTPVYCKTMVKGREGLDAELDRFDTKNRDSCPPEVEAELVRRIESEWDRMDAWIILDQVEEANCGVVTENVRHFLSRRSREDPGKIVFADSRRRIGLFSHILTKPNEAECIRAVRHVDAPTVPGESFTDGEVMAAARALQRRLNRPVFLTRGRKGIQILEGAATKTISAVKVPEPTDPTGAGDSTTAGIVLSLGAGATSEEAALIGSLVASITVQQLGTTGTASPDQLPDRLRLWQEQQR